MSAQAFQYDFSKIRKAEIKVKNKIWLFVFWVLLPTPLIIFMTFGILYLLQSPIEINSVMVEYGDPEYMSFFSQFEFYSGLISLLCFAPYLYYLFSRSNQTIYLSESLDLEPIIYFESKKKHVYICKDLMITHHLKFHSVSVETHQDIIDEEKSKYVFWLDEGIATKVKVRHQKNKIVIQYRIASKHIELRKRYALRLDGGNNIINFNEMISYYRYGNSNVQSFKSYFIVSYDSNLAVPIDSEIQRELSNRI